ncbi:MAG TPA: hypothetical protein V6C57_03875 [Coleofasciculaceae cyanobacterium]
MVNSPIETRIPFLENGDRLTAYEFERRYEATPNLKNAELIEGVVYVPAALRFKSHAEPHSAIMTWLGVYKALLQGEMPQVLAVLQAGLASPEQAEFVQRLAAD